MLVAQPPNFSTAEFRINRPLIIRFGCLGQTFSPPRETQNWLTERFVAWFSTHVIARVRQDGREKKIEFQGIDMPVIFIQRACVPD
jgi:hypothetical protein